MRIIKNEDGVSELVGAMLILLIVVLYLGVMQAYQVPEWNRGIVKQHFDKMQSDFVNLRKDLEDASVRNIAKTSSLHMGVRYPDRYILRNPGPGAYGTINMYPLNISISLNEAGTIENYSIRSTGIRYQLQGISDLPVLVYEHGLIIKDFGKVNFSVDENQSIFSNDAIFIPVIAGGTDSFSSIDPETLSFRPLPAQFYTSRRFSSLDVTLETRYPEVWAKWFTVENKTGCSEVSTEFGCIKIRSVPGYDMLRFSIANTTELTQDVMYSGMITIDRDTIIGSCNTGQEMWTKNQMCNAFPSSTNVSQFVISDITTGRSSGEHHDEDSKLKFSVKDASGDLWTTEIKLQNKSSSLIVKEVKQKYPHTDYCDYSTLFKDKDLDADLGGIIDLTPCYRNASISTPNVLVIDKMDNIIYANFVIN